MKDLWSRIKSEPERHRMRWCRGCKNLSLLDDCLGCCNYLERHGNQRGTPFPMDAPCPAYDRGNGIEVPEDWYQTCTAASAKKPIRPKPAGQRRPRARRKEGPDLRRATWDVDMARNLYANHWKISDIAEIVGTTRNAVVHMKNKQKWDGAGRKPNSPQGWRKHSAEEISEQKKIAASRSAKRKKMTGVSAPQSEMPAKGKG